SGNFSQLLVVDAVGGQGAGVAHAFLTGDDGQLVLVGDHDHGGHAGGDDVVRGCVDGVHISHHGLHHGLDVVGGGDGVVHCGQTGGLAGLMGQLRLDLGVGLGGAVENAHGLG